MSETVVITGAFSYTGKYVARLLLERGYQVQTLTFHAERANEFGNRVQVFPYNFDRPEELRRSFEGASVLINTYWVRFPHGGATFESAVHNSRILISAAKQAGVRRIVHVSIANPSMQSKLGYYRGKAEVEEGVRECGLEYAIVRPTVIFGAEDILVNNIAWFVRHFPLFAIPGDGRYAIRPIYVEDMARLLVEEVQRRGNSSVDAVGPETYTFEEVVRLIAKFVRRQVGIVHVPAWTAYVSTLMMGWFVRDTVLTWEEYKGLMDNLLAPEGPAAGETRLSAWLEENHETVGMKYASEMERHFEKERRLSRRA